MKKQPIEFIEVFRPIGPGELAKLNELKFAKWPPRLTDQPIFYPVTNEKYATEITAWNVKQFGIGYVTKFKIKKDFLKNYEIKVVGATYQTEWWIPSQNLEELNENIIGRIEVISEFKK